MTDHRRSVSSALDRFAESQKQPDPAPKQTTSPEKPRVPDIVLAKCDRSFGDKSEELRVALCEYEGKRYAGIRVFWKTPQGDFAPSKTGVTIRAKEIGEVIKALKTIAEELTGEVME